MERFPRQSLVRGVVYTAAVITGLIGLCLIFIATPARASSAADAPAPITSDRLCAATDVYRLATADDWGQRAVIARASLNWRAMHPAANCRAALTQALRPGLDAIRWQQALDAVDAVASGSYAIPLACARVNTVLTTGTAIRSGSPLFQHGTRAQCVIRDLAFVELRP